MTALPEGPLPRLFKAVACGNDFLVADARALPGWDPGPEATRLLCRRSLGFGADGLIVLGPSRRADASFFLRNRDGSTAAFSGNGARCAALVLHDLGASPAAGRVDLELAHRVAAARILGRAPGAEARVEVSIGSPRDVRLGLALPEGSPVPLGDHAVVGVPYLALRVASCEELDGLDLPLVAPPLRRWSALPEGANVAFWVPASASEPVRLRTWERGVEGETASSGTGCAMVALAVASRDERGPSPQRVEFAPASGARLAVTIMRDAGAIADLLLEGDARIVGELHVGPDALLPDP